MRCQCNKCGSEWYIPTPRFWEMTELRCEECGAVENLADDKESPMDDVKE